MFERFFDSKPTLLIVKLKTAGVLGAPVVLQSSGCHTDAGVFLWGRQSNQKRMYALEQRVMCTVSPVKLNEAMNQS